MRGSRETAGTTSFVEITRHPAPRAPAGRLPDFVVIGAAKAGSTSLWSYLSAHPQVFMSELKEPEFFNDERNWGRGVAWYRDQFKAAGEALVAGEASVRYATSRPGSSQVPERMAAVIPDAKLVYVVRHPVERMISQWSHNRARYAEPAALEDALSMSRYRDVSSYATQLDRFLAHYPPERVHLVVSERLRDDRAAELRRLFEFLGVDPEAVIEDVAELNRSADRRTPRPGMVRAMRHRSFRVLHRVLRRGAPLPVRRAVGFVTRGRSTPTACSAETFDRASAEFLDEVRRLRPHVTGPFDGWGIG